jgi:uncharacterized membrane protein YozB (DUF420 family)
MKTLSVLILLTLLISTLAIAFPASASNQPQIGVKNGDWAEYAVNITGGVPPPKLDLTCFKIVVFNLEGTAFDTNITVTYSNGTQHSTIWQFNFSEGKVGGWVIISANLEADNVFYDSSKPGNVTIEGQEQKMVAGATRTITHASDAKREVKEWDKATGVYTYSVEHPKNLTLTTVMVATNLWSANATDFQTKSQTPLYTSAVLAVMAVLIAVSTIVLANKKRLKLNSIRHQKIIALAVLAVLLLAVSSVGTVPMSESGLPLTFREINVIMQTFWMSILLMGMWFRRRGNYFLHEVLSIITVAATLVSFGLVLVMSPPGGSDMQVYFSSPLNLWIFFAHSVFSFPALIFGVWLVALWRPNSPTYHAKSRRIAQLTIGFWILSYVVGILDFLILRSNII